MEDVDPLALDRQLRRVACSWRRWRRNLRGNSGFDVDPFRADRERVATATTYDAVASLDGANPIRGGLLRWVYRLAEQRINRRAIVVLHHARSQVSVRIDEPERGEWTLSQLLLRALSSRDRSRRGDWLMQFFNHCEIASDRCALLWQRRMEIARRLGLTSPDVMELPCPDIARHAEHWLEETAGLFEEAAPGDGSAVLDAALGRGAEDGWPARITIQSMVDLIDSPELFRDVELEVDAMPERIAPASFLRGLARLGAAWIDATAPSDQPFVIAHDPFGLRRRTFGALFALLPTTLPFAVRRLDAARRTARDVCRAMAGTVLFESRAAAVRVALREAALCGSTQLRSHFEEHAHRSLRIPAPPSAAGAFLRLHTDDAQRLAGLWLASSMANALVEEYDDDWFRNPRAAERLRSEAAVSPVQTVDTNEIERGRAMLRARLEGALE